MVFATAIGILVPMKLRDDLQHRVGRFASYGVEVCVIPVGFLVAKSQAHNGVAIQIMSLLYRNKFHSPAIQR